MYSYVKHLLTDWKTGDAQGAFLQMDEVRVQVWCKGAGRCVPKRPADDRLGDFLSKHMRCHVMPEQVQALPCARCLPEADSAEDMP